MQFGHLGRYCRLVSPASPDLFAGSKTTDTVEEFVAPRHREDRIRRSDTMLVYEIVAIPVQARYKVLAVGNLRTIRRKLEGELGVRFAADHRLRPATKHRMAVLDARDRSRLWLYSPTNSA